MERATDNLARCSWALILLAVISTGHACLNGVMIKSGYLSCYDKRLIVDMHNQLRQAVANGRVGSQPPASNMLQMSWDEELARKAQSWADRCTFQHDSSSQRRVSRFSVGQNLAMTWNSPRPNSLGSNPDFGTQIKAWFDEVYKYGYNGKFTHASGHYSQMVWGDSYLIGCGYAYYQEGNRFVKLYVCNYGPGGNVQGSKPYVYGYPSCARYGMTPSGKYSGLCEARGIFTDPCYFG